MNTENFESLSPAEQRCAIAQDVIDRIDSSNIYPVNGRLIYIAGNVDFEKQESLKDAINSEGAVCHACAKGALIVSWIGNFNKYTFSDYLDFDTSLRDDTRYPRELLNLFGRDQLDLMEVWYEDCVYSWTSHNVASLGEPSSKYYNDLKGIMQNVIDNKGTFIPIYE